MTKDEFRTELSAQLSAAEKHGAPFIDVTSGELHRAVGGYPGPNHRMPVCCDVMYEAQRPSDETLASPDQGYGASLKIRYKLPR
jgi:5-methylcytosine-specific restriction protein A